MLNPRFQNLPYETGEANIPLLLSTTGIISQKKIIRFEGFSLLHIFVTQSGIGQFELLKNHRSWTLPTHTVCILPAGIPHTYYPLDAKPWMLGFLTLSGSMLTPFIEALRLPIMKPIPLTCTKAIWPTFENIDKLLSENQSDLNWRVSTLLYDFILEISKQSKKQYEPSSTNLKDSENAVQLATEMLHVHYNEPLLLADYARSLGYSVQHLNKLFKQSTGQTMHQYLENIRFEKAQQLLQQNMNIQDIASSLGMDANYFIRAFKKKHGLTPGQYRKRSQSQL